jgi:hypothetical protein
MDVWTRPLASAAILATTGWFAHGRLDPPIWIGAVILGSAIAWGAVTRASLRRLNRSSHLATAATTTGAHNSHKRSANRWQALLALVATPLLGGAAIAFTTPSILHSLDRHPNLDGPYGGSFPTWRRALHRILAFPVWISTRIDHNNSPGGRCPHVAATRNRRKRRHGRTDASLGRLGLSPLHISSLISLTPRALTCLPQRASTHSLCRQHTRP